MGLMDVNVKGLEPAVLARLSEQAAAEGMSQQEWLRQILRRTADRLSPAELVRQRSSLTPTTEADFDAARMIVADRRKVAVGRLGAPRGRR